MKKILIFNAFYWPGFKSGGPQQTIMNLVDTFGDKAQFFVITQNHDYISAEVYTEVKSDVWNKVGKAQVFYSSSLSFSFNSNSPSLYPDFFGLVSPFGFFSPDFNKALFSKTGGAL